MIYFMRHGQSEANAAGLFAGQRSDSPLTEKGREQAKEAADHIKTSGIRVDRIVASPLLRTRQTTEIVASELGIEAARVRYDKRLEEYDMGSFTGTPIHALSSAELTAHPDTENPQEFADRLMTALHELDREPGSSLVISHTGVWRMIEAVRRGIELKHFYDIQELPNGQVVELSLKPSASN